MHCVSTASRAVEVCIAAAPYLVMACHWMQTRTTTTAYYHAALLKHTYLKSDGFGQALRVGHAAACCTNRLLTACTTY